MCEEIRRVYQLYKNGLEKITDEERIFYNGWFEKPDSTKILDLENFRDHEDDLHVNDLSRIFGKACRKNEVENFKYLIDNYPIEILFAETALKIFKGLKVGNIKITTNSIEIIQILGERFPEFLAPSIGQIFQDNFNIKNFFKYENGNCDVILYLATNHKKELIEKPPDCHYEEKNIDCVNILLEKFPEFFDVHDDFSIVCDTKIAEIFIAFGIGKKIDPIYLVENPDFLIEYQNYLHIEEYLGGKHNFRSIISYISFMDIIFIFTDFMDYENAIDRNRIDFLSAENIETIDEFKLKIKRNRTG